MAERVPTVAIEVEWHKPHQSSAALYSVSSDRAATRAMDAARSAVQFALESTEGEAKLTITIKRKARRPVNVQIID
jgi:hypothetical protein